MKIKVLQYHQSLDEDFENKISVVIDVFRATSVIVSALAWGAEEIYVCENETEARHLYSSMCSDNLLLIGESGTQKIQGFDLGNSPTELLQADMTNKKIIMVTTNGTKAIICCKASLRRYICSFLNVQAIANQLLAHSEDVYIICSGSKGQYSLEDAFCAGMLISAINQLTAIDCDDYAYTLKVLFEQFSDNPTNLLSTSKAYKNLTLQRFTQDIDFCLQQNVFSIVPICHDSKITRR